MTQHIYVDTNAVAGGDGTTRAHSSGDGSHAFASSAAAAAAVPNPLVEEVRVHFAGTVEDTLSSFTSVPGNVTHRLFLVADEGGDHSVDGGDDGTLYNGDGWNDDVGGAWSTAHYRSFDSAGFVTLHIGSFTTVRGLQTRNTRASGNAECFRIGGAFITVERCRLTKDGTSGRGIFLNGSSTSIHTLRVFNNLIFECATEGLDIGSRSNADIAARIQHNVIINCGVGVRLVHGGNNPNFEIFNNVVMGDSLGAYLGLDDVNLNVAATHNAGESATAPLGHTSDWIGSVTSADFEQLASISGDYDDIDWRPATGSLLLDAGVNQGITEGFNEIPRDDPPDIGAFEIDSGSAVTGTAGQTLPTLEQTAISVIEAAATGAQTLAFLSQSATATSVGFAPDLEMGVELTGDDWLTRTSLIGVVNNKTLLFSAMLKRDTAASVKIWNSRVTDDGKSLIDILWNVDDSLHIQVRNADGAFGTDILFMGAAANALPSDGEYHAILASANLATGAAAVKIDDADVGFVDTITDEDIHWDVTNYRIGADAITGTSPYVGCMGEFILTNQYLDPLGNSGGPEPLDNYNLFFDGSGNPIGKGADGSIPTGTTPLVYCSGGAAQFAQNFGSAGSFTINGTLIDCPLVGGTPTGTSAQVLAAFTQNAVSSVQIVSTGAQELPAFEQAATSVLEISASAAQELPVLEQEGSATLTIVGNGVQALTSLEQVGSAELTITGAASQNLTALGQEAVGTAENEAGFGEQTLSSMEQTADGEEFFTGNLAQTLPVFIQNAAGEQVQVGVSGTASQELAAFSQTADSTLTISGIILQTLPALSQNSTGELVLVGIAVQTLPTFTQSTSGAVLFAGTAAQQLAAFVQTLTGTSLIALEGDGSQIVPTLQQLLTGVTYQDLLAAAEQDLPALTQVATALLFTGVEIKNVKFTLAQRNLQWALTQRNVQWALDS